MLFPNNIKELIGLQEATQLGVINEVEYLYPNLTAYELNMKVSECRTYLFQQQLDESKIQDILLGNLLDSKAAFNYWFNEEFSKFLDNLPDKCLIVAYSVSDDGSYQYKKVDDSIFDNSDDAIEFLNNILETHKGKFFTAGGHEEYFAKKAIRDESSKLMANNVIWKYLKDRKRS